MVDEKTLIEELKEELDRDLLDSHIQKKRRVFIRIKKDANIKVARLLKERHDGFLLVISEADAGEDLELVYHFAIKGEKGKEINVNVTAATPKNIPEMNTITDIIPGAIYPEREAQEMIGIKIIGIPDSRRLLLADDWPEGVHPLRKY